MKDNIKNLRTELDHKKRIISNLVIHERISRDRLMLQLRNLNYRWALKAFLLAMFALCTGIIIGGIK